MVFVHEGKSTTGSEWMYQHAVIKVGVGLAALWSSIDTKNTKRMTTVVVCSFCIFMYVDIFHIYDVQYSAMYNIPRCNALWVSEW